MNYLQKNVFAQSQHRTQKVEEPEDDEGWLYGPDFTSNRAIEMVISYTTYGPNTSLCRWAIQFTSCLGLPVEIIAWGGHVPLTP
jgi:hypothetical protein